MGRACGMHVKFCSRVLREKLKKTEHLEKHRRRWENNIKMDLTEIGLVLIGFMWLTLRTDLRCCQYSKAIRVAYNAGNFLTK
jgi:hypothetical protein